MAGSVEIARHERCYEAGDMVSDPRHDLALIETKPGALDQAAALQGRVLPSSFAQIRRLTEIAPPEVIGLVITDAIRRNVIGEAVKYSQTA
jgi:hypothetical protein